MGDDEVPDPDDGEKDDHLSDRVATMAWDDVRTILDDQPATDDPVLVQFAGIPLSGKSTIARALVADADVATVHVENDALRARVADLLDRPPQQDRFEHFVTYQSAWSLSRIALGHGAHAVHDATNLEERGRRKAYKTADAASARVFVVFVDADRDVLDGRAAHLDEDRREAYRKYRDKAPDPDACSRPHLVLDGARPVDEHLERLRATDALRPLWRA